jgi:hypothetical protein
MRSVIYRHLFGERATVSNVVGIVVLRGCHEADGFNLLHLTSTIPNAEKESLNSTKVKIFGVEAKPA